MESPEVQNVCVRRAQLHVKATGVNACSSFMTCDSRGEASSIGEEEKRILEDAEITTSATSFHVHQTHSEPLRIEDSEACNSS